MATRNMLIDASHPEETRVVVVEGSRVEDYDVEVASRRQLKGNIYLAKVTRVEPSLQAAFVDYGGNRHGFLAFNEIHPDYYQIPVADRERLMAEQSAAETADRDEDDDDDDDEGDRRRSRMSSSRHYKIQEVIKRRQIMLVQVAKEERGTKGAALTTYLSLAGRYCVLMPNTVRGGGISRKIAAVTDRKRLKKILSELEAPEGMAVIVRTAGAGRSKAEIKRDYEYLVRLWSNIRDTTLQSTAPTLVYEEASLIKRSIRDLYGRDIEEIIVQGEEEYRIAKEFMKLFISSHAKRVKLYEDGEQSLFQSYGVEEHLDSMHSPTVQLRSGGYIVINPTEALVAIDVNSGRSTRERNIEETALRTNLEAADEVGRQLRLRDLAGLIVVDFIDMENSRNQGMVERRMKEAMKNDRARVQLGRISAFGLLEMSRQRLRPSLIETSFEVCPSCAGTGLRRTTESTALAILRKLEEEGNKHRASEVSVAVPPAVALYLLNQKRRSLLAIEDRYHMAVTIIEDETLVPPDHRLERMKPCDLAASEEVVEIEERAPQPAMVEDEDDEEEEFTAEGASAGERDDGAGKRGRRRRPRRRRRGDEDASTSLVADASGDADGEPAEGEDADGSEDAGEVAAVAVAPTAAAEEAGEQQARRRRRRGKRGGRRRARGTPEAAMDGDQAAAAGDDAGYGETDRVGGEDVSEDEDEAFGDREFVEREQPEAAEFVAEVVSAEGATDQPVALEGAMEAATEAEDEPAPKPARTRRRTPRRRTKAAEETAEVVAVDDEAELPLAVGVAEADADVDAGAGIDEVSEVGGTRPPLADETDDIDEAEGVSGEPDQDRAAATRWPESDWSDEDRDRPPADEIVVVGGAYIPLEDDEAADEGEFGELPEPEPELAPELEPEAVAAEAPAEEAAFGEIASEHAAEEAVPEELASSAEAAHEPAAVESDQAEPYEAEPYQAETSAVEAAAGEERAEQPADGPSAEPPAEAPGEQQDQPPSEADRLAEAARGDVVHVSDSSDSDEESRRRGWWQRMLT